MAEFIKAGAWRINLSLVTEFEIVSDTEVNIIYIAAWEGLDSICNRSARKLTGDDATEFLRNLEKKGK